MTSEQGTSPGEWRRHWTLLLPCLAGITLAAVHGYSLGVMIAPLEQEFGWTRAQISAGPLVISFIALAGTPVVGIGVDRFGPRRIAIFGVLLFSAALAITANAGPGIFSWWLCWALLGIAVMFINPVVWTAAINSVFDRNRGKALALALCGTGVSAAVVPPLTQAVVSAYGWREAYLVLAGAGALIVLPLVLFLFRSAKDAPAQSAADASALPGFSRREGFASPAFRKLAAAIFLFGIGTIALTTNAVPVLRAAGFDAGEAAGMAGLIGIGSVAGRLLGGLLLDQFDAKKVAAVSTMAPVISAALLIAMPGQDGSAMIACLLLGLALGTEVDACAYLAARHFGLASFGALFGAINGLLLFGTGLSPLVANYVFDVTGGYEPVLWSLAPMCLAAALLFLSLGNYPRFTVPVLTAS